MKKNALFVCLLCFITSFIACDDNENENTNTLTEYILPDGCSWISDLKSDDFYRINSLKELEDFVFCNNTSDIDINFKDYTLLLIPIGMPDPGHYFEYEAKQTKDSYIINIKIINGDGVRPMVPVVYHLAFLVNKNESNMPVELNISR